MGQFQSKAKKALKMPRRLDESDESAKPKRLQVFQVEEDDDAESSTEGTDDESTNDVEMEAPSWIRGSFRWTLQEVARLSSRCCVQGPLQITSPASFSLPTTHLGADSEDATFAAKAVVHGDGNSLSCDLVQVNGPHCVVKRSLNLLWRNGDGGDETTSFRPVLGRLPLSHGGMQFEVDLREIEEKAKLVLAFAFSVQVAIKPSLSDYEALKLDEDIDFLFPESALEGPLVDFLTSGLLADAALSCQGETIHCHRAVLAANSDVFRAMFSHGTTREAQTGQVLIEDCDVKDLRRFVSFLYSPQIQKPVSAEELLGLFVLSDRYQVQSLKTVTVDALKVWLSDNEIGSELARRTFPLLDKSVEFGADEVAESVVHCLHLNLSGSRLSDWEALEWQMLIRRHPRITDKIMELRQCFVEGTEVKYHCKTSFNFVGAMGTNCRCQKCSEEKES